MSLTQPPYYPLNEYTYNQLQKLQAFVDFVASLPETEDNEKQHIDKIKEHLKNITHPENQNTSWMVAIDLLDDNILQEPQKNAAMYWRRWWLTFEFGMLEVMIKDDYIYPDRSLDDDIIYDLYIGCNTEMEVEGKFVHGAVNVDVDKFLTDAFQFRSYISGTLQMVETTIDMD